MRVMQVIGLATSMHKVARLCIVMDWWCGLGINLMIT
ncbi:hypothetical protein QF014_002281 [Pantoea agglomerans]|nr:hypothetical protein [Pantoea agglomerans]